MGLPLMIQEDDNSRLENLKSVTGAKTKVQVLRNALTLLEQMIQREKKIARWKVAASLVKKESAKVNHEFQNQSRLKVHD